MSKVYREKENTMEWQNIGSNIGYFDWAEDKSKEIGELR